ncbi:cytosine permease [Streptomyces sp. NPDC058092]|uniref:cytosine permease n=1 Tax=Streptomyces sp. NPDC058092 TaxID=3346336 RepID=UPI0036F110EF
MFAGWAAANVNYPNLVVGGALILMGLGLWQALAVILVANLFWAPVGLPAVFGPASGTPGEVITCVMFGIRGNQANIAVTGWILCICHIAHDLAAAALAALSRGEGRSRARRWRACPCLRGMPPGPSRGSWCPGAG